MREGYELSVGREGFLQQALVEQTEVKQMSVLEGFNALIEEKKYMEAKESLLEHLRGSQFVSSNEAAREKLPYVERLYALASNDEERKNALFLVSEYRAKHGLGKLWQFFDSNNEMIFESTNVEEVREKLLDGTIKRNYLCQKNRVGDFLSINDSLCKEESSIELLLSPISYHVLRGAGITAVITVIGSFFAVFINLGLSLQMSFFQTLAFAVVFLIAIGSVGASSKNKGGCIITFILGFVLIAITGFTINFAFLGGFFIGFIIGMLLSALVGAIPGAIIGAIIGLIRMPFLPRLPA